MTVRFLHLADIHLGNDQYRSPVRAQDMYEAFRDAIVRFGIEQEVDFIAIAGDLFDKRNVSPAAMLQAIEALKLCKEAGIPVVAIEGNHDRAGERQTLTWLHCLADWDYLKLLAPEEDLSLLPFDEQTKRGGFLEIKGCRLIGTRWFGASVTAALPRLAESIQALTPVEHQVFLLHAAMEGQVPRMLGGLTTQDLAPIREAKVDYVALGHIHQRYEVDGWIFNPGSPEACSVSESELPRGAFLVELSDRVQARFLQDQVQRPFLRLSVDLTPFSAPEEALRSMLETIEATPIPPVPPVVEFTTTGTLSFPRHLLETKTLEAALRTHFSPVVVLLK
ncbi:MAG: metallophosphoesterase family protein, partial [Bacteroidota bacterium]